MSSNVEDFKCLIGMALKNKFSWKSLGNLLEEMAPTLAECKQLVTVLLTELQSFHENKQVLNQPEVNETFENEMEDLETLGVQNDPAIEDQIDDTEDKISNTEQVDQIIKDEIEIIELENPNVQISQRVQDNIKQQRKKKFQCNYCPKSFRAKQELERHQISHTGERPFDCKLCDKKFAQSTSLKVHEKRHFGIKEFKCPTCEKCFVESAELRTHQRKHTGEKPFQCKVCKRSFSTSTSQKNHQFIHFDYLMAC